MKTTTVLALCLCTFITSLLPAAEPSADAAALIAEFGLRDSEQPVSARANWRKPKRIVVDAGVPGLLAGLAGSAPGVQFVAANTPADMAVAAKDADVVIGRTGFVCNPAVLAPNNSVRWAQTIYSGIELCLPHRARFEQDVLLTNMRAVGSPAIAEHTIALMFGLARGLHVSIPNQATGAWRQDESDARAITLRGKTVLIVGLGGIGIEVAKRADALGMRVIGTRASDRPAPSYVRRVGKPEELASMLPDADVVVMAAPLTPATRGLFNAQMFARMKRSAYFINVARGGAVVTADLIAALEAGTIAGAGLDVTDPEPLPADHPLWKARNVIITPHVAGSTDIGIEAQLRVVRENVRRYVAGERMLSVVDVERAY
jgi:phosphoglycerate dehydrogenase-like enzyme